MWVRTGKQPGRGLDWVRSKPERTLVVEAKGWREGKEQIRKAVTGGLFRWEGGGLVGEDGETDEGSENGSSDDPRSVGESGEEGSDGGGVLGGPTEEGRSSHAPIGPVLRMHGKEEDLTRCGAVGISRGAVSGSQSEPGSRGRGRPRVRGSTRAGGGDSSERKAGTHGVPDRRAAA